MAKDGEEDVIEEVRARKAGGSVTITLPIAMVKKLDIAAGDRLWVAEVGEGLLITTAEEQFGELAAQLRAGTVQYRQALLALER